MTLGPEGEDQKAAKQRPLVRSGKTEKSGEKEEEEEVESAGKMSQIATELPPSSRSSWLGSGGATGNRSRSGSGSGSGQSGEQSGDDDGSVGAATLKETDSRPAVQWLLERGENSGSVGLQVGASCTDRQPSVSTQVAGQARHNIHSEGLRAGELAAREGPLEGAHLSGASRAEVAKQTPLDQRQKSNAQTEAQAGSLMAHYLESFGAGGSIGVGGPLAEAKRADCGSLVGAPELTVRENCNTRLPSGATQTRDSESWHPKGVEIGTSLPAKSTTGRPLSQAATNRAKFAIRSYTIAVSK